MTMENVELHLVDDFESAEACLRWLSEVRGDRIGLDIEGTGLSPETDRVRLVQVGDETHGWAIPFEDWRGLVVEIIRRWRGRFVGHNIRFDVAMLRAEDIDVDEHRCDDTRFLAHIIDPTRSVALKGQAARYIDSKAAFMQRQLDDVMHSSGYTWATIPIRSTGPLAVYWIYGALDPVLTMRLWNHHHPIVARTAPAAYDLELATGWIVNRMERAGVLVDRELTQATQTDMRDDFEAVRAEAHDAFGVDLASAAQVRSALLADDVPLWKRSDKTGEYSLDRQALAGIDHPIVAMLHRYKRLEKFSSTYLRRFLEYSEHDGRLHPRINTIGGSGKTEAESGGEMGVRTARMSMERPNLQQLPRRDEDDLTTIAIRDCIMASPGHTLLMCDFDQVEARIMAHLSADPGLLAAFSDELDFFVKLSRQVYGDDTIVKSDPRRQLIKSYVYSKQYGAGLDKQATTAGVSLTVMERLDADFNRSYPGVRRFQHEVQRRARQRLEAEGTAYAMSPLTGRRFLVDGANDLYKLINFIIQGMAAEILKMKLCELDAAGVGHLLRLPVHDEELLEVPNEDVRDVAHIVHEVMNDYTLLSVPLTAGLASGERWGSKKDMEL